VKIEQHFEVVVGLGNPGEQYQNTRHNVGQRVVDLLASADEVDWIRGDQSMVAQIERQGKTVYLVKSLTKVNNTGQMLLQLADQIGYEPSQCILVHDDLDLALGDVRLRTKGSAGGHNGIRSIIDAFQSEDFRRIKIGIGRPERKNQITEYVLKEFARSERSIIEQAYIEAADRVLTYIARN
jgi:PTH1 family peptidyl-tRNA hydrolase